jgi:hypothetical protein
VLTIELYGGTRARRGAAIGVALGSALGLAAILPARGKEEPAIGYAYAGLAIGVFTSLGALIGVAMPVWRPLSLVSNREDR